jgi:uncharacterized protein with NAD-binding domain and iron-sulfur cluster
MSESTSADRPVKVAVVGGGCASIAAAFELTRPELRGKYEVTVYQLGFRLGGKGASGRGPADRIEEHGLHLWMGFYENAFRLMRECYRELGRDPAACRIADWTDAFIPANFNAVTDWSPRGAWSQWQVLFPPSEGQPGDLSSARERWTVARYLVRCLRMVRTLVESVEGSAPPASPAPGSPDTERPPSGDELIRRMTSLLRLGSLASIGAFVEALTLLQGVLKALPVVPDSVVLRLQTAVLDAIRKRLDALAEADDQLRRLWEMVDLVLAVVRGAIRFRLLTDPRGFDAINDYDCREWLRLNGASDRSINGAFVRALYDLAFAYEDGDIGKPRIAAGQALRGAVRAFFTYRGAFFWQMRSGMGDVVFAPFYEVLKRRGVRFAFFHRLENVKVAETAGGQRPFVEALEFDVQAEIEGGGEYRPLVDVRGLPCWPSSPDYAQLVDGAALEREQRAFESHWDTRRAGTKTLRVTEDFDFVVLGTSLGAIPHVGRELIARSNRFRTMVRHCKTVATQAFQIWMDRDMRELGWLGGPTAVSGFVEPFDTWADMSHLGSEESWPETPRSIAYFCSALADRPEPPRADGRSYVEARRDEVRRNATVFLDRHISELWPQAVRAPGQFRWDLLCVPPGSDGSDREARLASQYFTANVNPTDRYALSLPGTLRYRLSPLEMIFDNLTVAGDWTDCGFNEGCVEAAVMSGRLAAHAISQNPPLEEIVGFDHP